MQETHPVSDQDVDSLLSPAVVDAATPLLEYLQAGGPVLVLLAVLSVGTLALILAKAFQFSAARLGEHAKSGALARVRHQAQAALQSRKGEKAIEKAGYRAARKELRPLEVGLGLLGMIAMLSPLIGLLGTVIGMIDAFRALETAGGSVDPSLLSAGIWVALLTTAAGLIVAIPATIAHGWFEGRLSRFAELAEHAIAEIAEVEPIVPHRLGVAAD